MRITKKELLALAPCDPESRIKLFGRRKYMTVEIALKAGVSISDILWVAGRMGLKTQCVQFALECAVHVEHLDTSGTAKRCNDATRNYIADPSPSNAWARESASASASAWARESARASASASASAWESELKFQKAFLIKIFGGK